MAKMTKRERVLRTIRLQETDRVPVYDILQNDGVIEYLAGQPLTVENGLEVKGKAIARSLDMTRMADGPLSPGLRRTPEGLLYQDERWTTWVIERPWHDRAGLLEWIRQQIQSVNARQFGPAEVAAFEEYRQRRQAAFGDDTVLVIESGVGLTEMYATIGWEDFAYLLADEPDLMVEWLDARHRAELRRVAAIGDGERIPVALTYDDIAFKTGTLISPRWLRAHWFPRLKQLNDAWHERGTACLFHSDGDLWSVMDDLVAAGIDGLNPIEVAAGMTVRQVRERYPQLFLTGGVDVSQLLPLGIPDEVREATLENIAATGEIGYFVGSTTELHWKIPVANIMAMFQAAWGGD